MDVPEDDQIERLDQRRRIFSINGKPSAVKSFLVLQISPFELSAQRVGQGLGNAAKCLEKGSTLQDCFPGGMCPEPMAVGDLKLEPLHHRLESIGQEGRTEDSLVERADPGVMIASQDGDIPTSTSEIGQGSEPFAVHRVGVHLARGEPEIAEVANDRQPILRSQSIDQPR